MAVSIYEEGGQYPSSPQRRFDDAEQLSIKAFS